jgi:hypothetical protein
MSKINKYKIRKFTYNFLLLALPICGKRINKAVFTRTYVCARVDESANVCARMNERANVCA